VRPLYKTGERCTHVYRHVVCGGFDWAPIHVHSSRYFDHDFRPPQKRVLVKRVD
jgi:hypothetical protein